MNCCVAVIASEALDFTEEETRLVISSTVELGEASELFSMSAELRWETERVWGWTAVAAADEGMCRVPQSRTLRNS